jgi:3-phenylpropionate/trans-cinnamate dioxygenase ferredoxin subunit
VCPRHGAHIDIRSGRPLTLPAVLPVETFPVSVVDGMITVDIT